MTHYLISIWQPQTLPFISEEQNWCNPDGSMWYSIMVDNTSPLIKKLACLFCTRARFFLCKQYMWEVYQLLSLHFVRVRMTRIKAFVPALAFGVASVHVERMSMPRTDERAFLTRGYWLQERKSVVCWYKARGQRDGLSSIYGRFLIVKVSILNAYPRSPHTNQTIKHIV